MNRVINIKNTYLLLIIVIGLVVLTTYSTYALFSDSLETEELVSISAINLNIDIDNLKTYNQIDLNPYEKKSILIKLSNSTDKLNYYKIWYEMINPNKVDNLIKVFKSSSSKNNTTGTINAGNILEIEINIINYSNKNISINLGIENSENNNIVLKDNRNEIYEVDETTNELSWSSENDDFVIGKCTKFSMNDKPSGVYKIDLYSSNNNFVTGSLYLNNDKNLYVCVSQNETGNENTQILLSEPNKDWNYITNKINVLISVNNNEGFVLTKNNYLDLIDKDDKYKIDNVSDYYLSNTNMIINKNNNINLNNGSVKISLVLEHKKIDKSIKINKVFINSKLSEYPTNGNYYLTDYECTNTNSNLYWDNSNYTLFSNNINNEEVCDIYLSTEKKLLSSAKQGDYVEYIATGGIEANNEIKCSGNECLGNVNFCNNEHYNNSGFRIAYVLNDGNNLIPYLISGGIVECSNQLDIGKLNNLSIKYCNETYIYGNNCNKNNGAVNTWIFNSDDFKRILFNGYDINKCNNLNYIDNMCGYNSDLINIGGSYSIISGNKIYNFNKLYNGINDQNFHVIGNRVIVKLDPNIEIISGSGLKNDPYKICLGDNC